MFYKYKVRYYRYDSTEELEEVGIVYGKTYGEAIMAVEEDYGPDDVIGIYIECLDDSKTLSIKELKALL